MQQIMMPQIGYKEVLWQGVGEGPNEKGSEWSSSQPPQAGEIRWVAIDAWHRTVVGESVWLFYEPMRSMRDGWNYPEELDCILIARCRLEETFEAEYNFANGYWNGFYKGWAKFNCEQVLSIVEIPQHFPEQPVPDETPKSGYCIWPNGKTAMNYESIEREHFICHQNLDQDATQWWFTTKTQPARVVLHQFADSWEEMLTFEICNYILPD